MASIRTGHKVMFVVVEVSPIEEPKRNNGEVPRVGTLRIRAMSGIDPTADLTWTEPLSSDTPRVGQRFYLEVGEA
jgi:hypothetical protein